MICFDHYVAVQAMLHHCYCSFKDPNQESATIILPVPYAAVSLNVVAVVAPYSSTNSFYFTFTLLYGPFLWMGFNCLKVTATSRRQFTFYHSVPRNSWYSFYRPQKDERLSRPWSHPVVLNMGLLDWESSTFAISSQSS